MTQFDQLSETAVNSLLNDLLNTETARVKAEPVQERNGELDPISRIQSFEQSDAERLLFNLSEKEVDSFLNSLL